MGLTSSAQDDFGGGMYRGRKAPATAFYDGTNVLLDDEGQPFKRGGSAYLTTSDAATLVGLADVNLPTLGDTTLMWGTVNIFRVNGASPSSLASGASVPAAWVRGVAIGDYWLAPSKSGGGVVSTFDGSTNSSISYAGVTSVDCLATVGTKPRLIVCSGNRAWFTDPGGDHTLFTGTDYHQLPNRARIKGADSIGDSAILFTTIGVWAVGNMNLDPIDDFGNLQHTVSRVSDLLIWGDAGIARYATGLIVPALDDVFMFSLDGPPVPLTGGRGNQYDGGIRSLYRSYVKAGYQPGLAAVHRGHYILPILSGNTLIDVLVCRVDRGAAFTRWDGHAAGGAYATRVGDSTRSPKLYGINGTRVTNLTDCFDPTSANAVEADGTTHSLTLTTRDYPTGGNQHGFVQRARLRYELTDDGSGATAAPTVALAYSSDQDAGAFTTLTEKGEQNGGAGGGVSDGSKYMWWLVGKRRERIRFRLTVTGACASFVLRSLELLTRPSGKQ